MKFFALILCCATLVPAQEDSRQWLNKGVKAFKANDYAGAVDAFERAVALAPNEPAPHLYLASAYASRLMPDAQNPENQVLAAKVAREYQRVLEIEPRNKAALVGLANFSFQQKKFDQAKELSERILAIDPYEKETYYRLGVIAWSKAFPVRMEARSKVGMRPEEPGPLPPSVRFDVANQNRQIVLDGIRNLEKAIDIDPQYDDALAYINLLYRERADLADTREALPKLCYSRRRICAANPRGQESKKYWIANQVIRYASDCNFPCCVYFQ